MNAEVDERTAARIFLVAEPSAGAAVSAEIGCLCVVYFAELTCIDEFLDDCGIVAVASDKADHQQLAALLRSLSHLACLSRVHCHGLFADYVDARIQCGNGCTLVRRIPCRDRNGVQLFVFQHFVIARICVWNTLSLFLCFFKINITAGNDINVVSALIAGEMTI